MSKKLELLFENELKRQITITVDAPEEPVRPELVYESMQQMLASEAITSNGGHIVSIRGARLVDRTVEEIELPV